MNAVINNTVQVINIKNGDYQEVWDEQTRLFNEIIEIKLTNRHLQPDRQQSTPNYLMICEHPHVYTLGKSGKEKHLLLDQAGLKRVDARYYKINRGGDITYHGPGQIVAYPILDLENFFTDIHKYLRLLEEAVILTLKEYDIDAGRIPGFTGVWLDYDNGPNPRKICAFGVKSSRWVTMHGLAFNVNTDLNYFVHIVPCGIEDKAVTSMAAELGRVIPLPEVQKNLSGNVAKLFGMELKL